MKHFWRLLVRTRADGCTGLAAMLAYDFFLVIPAVMIFLVAALSYLPIDNLGQSVTDQFRDLLPADTLNLMQSTIEHTLQRAGQRTLILAMSLIGAMYVMNSGYAGLISSLNRVYRLQERRRWVMVRLRALVMSIFAAAIFLLTLSLVLLAPHLVDLLAESAGASLLASVLRYIRWPIIVLLAFFGMETTYRYAPCGGPRWRFVSPGTIVATALWLLTTVGFGVYVNHFGTYDRIYGTLGAVIATLVWIWMSAMIFLVGAEINALLREPRGDSA